MNPAPAASRPAPFHATDILARTVPDKEFGRVGRSWRVGFSAEELEGLYADRYWRYRNAAAAVLGDLETAHDAVQDAFARALASRKRFRGGSLDAWVWTILVRRLLDEQRRRRAVPLDEQLDAGIVVSERDPELAAAIRRLPPRRRLVVFLRYYADLSYDQIAEVCEVSAGTVAATLSQAHAALREALTAKEVER
jgi:RNA polymerase sigma factor (sigma-70 family)